MNYWVSSTTCVVDVRRPVLGLVLCCTLVTSAFGEPAVPADATITVRLKKETYVKELEYHLSDVADITSNNQALAQSIASLVLGRAPRVGYSKQLPRQEILARLDAFKPGLYRTLRWEGPPASIIRTVGSTFSATDYVRPAKESLYRSLVALAPHVEIAPVGVLKDLRLPSGDVQVVPRVCDENRLRRRMCAWVDILVDGRHYQSLAVWFAVSAYKSVRTARNDLRAGNEVTEKDFITQQRDVAPLTEKWFAPEVPLVGQRLRRPMTAGQVLTADFLEPIPAVIAGQRVKVEVQVGRIIVTTTASALEDGQVGDEIGLQKPDGTADYKGLVVGQGIIAVKGD